MLQMTVIPTNYPIFFQCPGSTPRALLKIHYKLKVQIRSIGKQSGVTVPKNFGKGIPLIWKVKPEHQVKARHIINLLATICSDRSKAR